jgi:aryl-alcohol dehydrogenase-like predicted oxidoreductase
MEYGSVPGLDKPVSRLILGATPIPHFDEKVMIEGLEAAIELGCNTIDSAHIYYGGQHERALGKWIRENNAREKVVILAKGAHHNQDRHRVTPFDIASDLHDTLSRFRVDYVDLLVLHRDDPSVPVGPIVEALNEQVRAGKVKAFGGSNWSHERLAEANAYAKEHGLIPFALSNPQLSLAEQIKEPWKNCISISGPENEDVREWYRREGMAVFAWSSLAGGFLSGRLRRDNVDEYKAQFGTLALESYGSEDNFRRLDRAFEIAKAKDATVPQIALAWVLGQPLNVFALVGAASRAEFEANVKALEINLTPQEMAYLDLKADSPA